MKLNAVMRSSLMATLAISAFGAAPTAAATITFSNQTAVSFPSQGPASVYPLTIDVSGFSGVITDLSLTLTDLNHTFPDDFDFLLVGPTGASLVFFSDVGGNSDIANVTITLSDSASSELPDATALTTGTFRPTNYSTVIAVEAFPAPAPGGPYVSAGPTGTATFLSVFGGTAPNGAWQLFGLDDSLGDIGTLAGGWSLTITADTATPPVPVPEPASLSLLALALACAWTQAWRRRST